MPTRATPTMLVSQRRNKKNTTPQKVTKKRTHISNHTSCLHINTFRCSNPNSIYHNPPIPPSVSSHVSILTAKLLVTTQLKNKPQCLLSLRKQVLSFSKQSHPSNHPRDSHSGSWDSHTNLDAIWIYLFFSFSENPF